MSAARAARLRARLDELFEIGRAIGTNRIGLGPGEQAAHELVAGWMREAGLEVSVDRAGNLYGRLAGADPALAEVWSGSHLDTPFDGGRFDGATGVLAALDAAEAIGAAPGARRTLAVVAFRLEEGPRFGRGVFGSRAVAGALEDDEAGLRDADGVTLGEAFAALGLGELPREGWLGEGPASFLEAHIEQGPVLAAHGERLGVVTSIAGMAGLEISFGGLRGHAGTVPMPLRRDALATLSEIVLAMETTARQYGPKAVGTVGEAVIANPSRNVIPGEIAFTVDCRSADAAIMDALDAGLRAAIKEISARRKVDVKLDLVWRKPPTHFDPKLVNAVEEAAQKLGFSHRRITSGAGHDACNLNTKIPAAMVFVPCKDGVSHNELEDATQADCSAGANVLMHTVLALAGVAS